MASKTKKIKIIKLELTPQELVHLRDLFSITLPDGERTVSSCLAAITKRQTREGILWKKISTTCKQNSIPVGPEAPDFILGVSSVVIDVCNENNNDDLEEIILE